MRGKSVRVVAEMAAELDDYAYAALFTGAMDNTDVFFRVMRVAPGDAYITRNLANSIVLVGSNPLMADSPRNSRNGVANPLRSLFIYFP
jgi:hypothetical protein